MAAAAEPIAEVGFAQASLARIAERIGVSKGVISYHFAGKDELVHEVIADVALKGEAFLRGRAMAEATGSGRLRAGIESNLELIGTHRTELVAFYEIAVSSRGNDSVAAAVGAVLRGGIEAIRELLSSGQASGEYRRDFDLRVTAMAIRAAIDAVPPRLAPSPAFDVGHYGRELANLFDAATRVATPRSGGGPGDDQPDRRGIGLDTARRDRRRRCGEVGRIRKDGTHRAVRRQQCLPDPQPGANSAPPAQCRDARSGAPGTGRHTSARNPLTSPATAGSRGQSTTTDGGLPKEGGEAMPPPLERPGRNSPGGHAVADRPVGHGQGARPTEPDGSKAEAALVVEHLSKRFGSRVAFEDVSFEVGYGEVFGFLGPNGAGKTTTVRTLGTLLVPTSGSAMVAGIPLRAENGPAIRQRISIMPESPGLYLRLTVNENLECFAGLYELSDRRARIERALQAVNLTDRADDPCRSLSKGLRQRVALARALLNDPAVLFLDEPTSGLDPVAAREVHELIASLRERGVTIFLTTHRLEEAERLCDQVAILNTTMRLVGRPDELRARLFSRSLEVRLRAELTDPAQVFAGIAGVERWEKVPSGMYALTVDDPDASAPDVARALVHAGADILSITESHHSLEDVYLREIDEDVEAKGH